MVVARTVHHTRTEYRVKHALGKPSTFLEIRTTRIVVKLKESTDVFLCRRCGKRATEVHHETYKRIYNEQLSDLTALCGNCHEAAHSGKNQMRTEGTPQKSGYRKPKQRRFYRKRKAKTETGGKRSERYETPQ